tara:strand:- start:129 stop:422 length:294 start_codon:yes stop_codon:yes gene_type:complete
LLLLKNERFSEPNSLTSGKNASAFNQAIGRATSARSSLMCLSKTLPDMWPKRTAFVAPPPVLSLEGRTRSQFDFFFRKRKRAEARGNSQDDGLLETL